MTFRDRPRGRGSALLALGAPASRPAPVGERARLRQAGNLVEHGVHRIEELDTEAHDAFLVRAPRHVGILASSLLSDLRWSWRRFANRNACCAARASRLSATVRQSSLRRSACPSSAAPAKFRRHPKQCLRPFRIPHGLRAGGVRMETRTRFTDLSFETVDPGCSPCTVRLSLGIACLRTARSPKMPADFSRLPTSRIWSDSRLRLAACTSQAPNRRRHAQRDERGDHVTDSGADTELTAVHHCLLAVPWSADNEIQWRHAPSERYRVLRSTSEAGSRGAS